MADGNAQEPATLRCTGGKVKDTNPLSRRNFFKTGISAIGVGTGAILTNNALAQMCGVATGSQLAGPFFPWPETPQSHVHEDSDPTTPIFLANDNDLTFVQGKNGTATGQIVYVNGLLTDQACRPIPQATMIIWQASASGRYNHKRDVGNQDFQHPLTGEIIRRRLDPFFQYWGKAVTNERGEYSFKTIVPGFYPANVQSDWYRPPHIHFRILAPGFAEFITQMYFRGEEIVDNDWIQELNRKDHLLQNPEITGEQREKLVVDFKRESRGLSDGPIGQFDIILTNE